MRHSLRDRGPTGRSRGRPLRMITPPVSQVLPDARTHAVEYDHWFEEPWGRYAFGVEYRTLFYAAGPLDGTRVVVTDTGWRRMSSTGEVFWTCSHSAATRSSGASESRWQVTRMFW